MPSSSTSDSTAIPLPANAAQETAGNLAAIAAAMRIQNRIAIMQLRLIQHQPSVGFTPIEIPEFLGGT